MRVWKMATMAAILTISQAAEAQRAVRIGIASGVGFAVGRFSDAAGVGPGFLLTVATGGNSFPLGVRLDVSDHLLYGRKINGMRQDNTHMKTLTANVFATLPVGQYGHILKPYVIMGVGVHPFKLEKRTYDFGINGGAGFTFPVFNASGFAEVRYHRIYGRDVAQRYVPVSIGVMF